MKCFHHPSEDAVATCAKCGVGLCKECEEASKFRIDSKALCGRCNAEEQRKETEKRNEGVKDAIAEYARHKRRLIWFSILFIPGIFIFVAGFLSNQLTPAIVGCLLIWGISGIGSVIKDAFTPTKKSVKQQTKEALAEHENPMMSFIGNIIGFFVKLICSYIIYAAILPLKWVVSLIFVILNKKKINELQTNII
ncbi:MAG: hypothetical protein LBF01_00935 [Bacteroidales bacterium]|jgi:hypothetical protein|nr:hypothetical protein [Bacteroidales bacterium]